MWAMLVSLFGEKTAQEELRRRGKCSLFPTRYTPQPNKTLKFQPIPFNKHWISTYYCGTPGRVFIHFHKNKTDQSAEES